MYNAMLETGKFYYPINLHYSQTMYNTMLETGKFYYPINLHYSQTLSTAGRYAV